MVRRSCGVAVLAAAGFSSGVGAQALDTNDRPFMEAAIVVMGYDMFAERCAAGSAFTAEQQRLATAWQRDNDVALVRDRVVVLERDPATRKKLADTRAAFAQRFTSVQGSMACVAAIAVVKQPDAELARKSPEMLRALRAQAGVPGTGGSVAAASPSPPATPSAPTRTGGDADGSIARRIDAFGFDTRPEMGMGGFIGLAVYPVVLFRDGTALTDVEGLGAPDGIDAHRRAHPSDWSRWRRQGGELQLLKDGKWEKLAFRNTYSTLPANFRLNGRFRRSSGTGNIAIGGTSSVIVTSQYEFTAEGTVVRDRSVGATATGGNTRVTTSSVAPNRRGRYTIDGITLRIRYDDGSEERRILVTDPTDPKSVIWLDGDSYVRR